MKQVRTTFPCGDILLEGVWHLPQSSGLYPVVIVCHPHPLYGGDMGNNVVMAICEALPRKSVAAFRFNFRGVGGSQGVYGEGIAEQDDVKAALDFVSASANVDKAKLGLAGYSFGAMVALPVAIGDARVRLLALVSPAIADGGWEQLRGYKKPTLILSGSRDEVAHPTFLGHYLEIIPDNQHGEIVRGADHFWAGYEAELAEKISRFFALGFNVAKP